MQVNLQSLQIAKLLNQSIDFRAEAAVQTESIIRLCAGTPDGLPGLIVDKWGQFIVATGYDSDWAAELPELKNTLKNRFKNAVVLCRSRRKATDPIVVEQTSFILDGDQNWNAEYVTAAMAHNCKFEIRGNPIHDFGIFADSAAARERVSEIVPTLSQGRVLNLFAYSCAFGVVAAKAGASEVTNIDPNKDYLAWGLKNGTLNSCSFKVIPETTQKFLTRLQKRIQAGTAQRPELVISDPPAFGVGHGAARLLRTYWGQMVEEIVALEPQHIIILCNDRVLRQRVDVRDLILKSTEGVYNVEEIEQSSDVQGQAAQVQDSHFIPPLIFHLWKS